MATVGKLQGAFASFSSENTAALININLDFSVYRCNPSPEFLPIGPALTVRRREEAESGQIHKTVCTLGFLFREILPDTAAVFRAYGQRASEIMTQPGINPQGAASDGAFQPYIGADGTSLWAAATSSDASIAVHLLACVLARAFNAKDATSIWVELISERKKEIDAIEEHKMFSPHTYAASKQSISRDEIATFDASARAWLRRADMAMSWARHQYLLVVKNIQLPYSLGPTYTNVISTWIQTLKVMNNLFQNLPQEAADRSVLLAISSWHMYPDLLVFQDQARNIPFKDSLFPPSAVLSLGLEYNSGPQQEPMRWSLALSHLRYYGTVRVESCEDKPRITIDQLWFVALGCLFRAWKINSSQFLATIEWLKDLGDLLSSHPNGQVPEVGSIRSFCHAANKFGSLDRSDHETSISWIKFGWRRGEKFLGRGHTYPCRYFGLRDLRVLRALDQGNDIDKGITYQRHLLSELQSYGRQAIVSYTAKFGSDVEYFECATTGTSALHRWIYLLTSDIELPTQYVEELEKRRQHIKQLGERCDIIYDRLSMPRVYGNLLSWRNPPSETSRDALEELHFKQVNTKNAAHSSDGFNIWIQDDGNSRWIDAIDVSSVALEECREADFNILKSPKHAQDVIALLRFLMEVSPFSQLFLTTSLTAEQPKHSASPRPAASQQPSKRRKVSGVHHEHSHSPAFNLAARTNAPYILMTQNKLLSFDWIRSVLALDIATALYRGLPGATISSQVIELELHKASWLPDGLLATNRQAYFRDIIQIPADEWLKQMGRTNAFGCIAMFETGRFNMNLQHLEEVVALCNEDSIFVAGILLSDPCHGNPLGSSGPVVRHLVGSIGKAGLVLLVSPLEPRIRPKTNNPLLVEHKVYDGESVDQFEGVSFHLSFTEWKAALDWENTGEIDQEVFLVESVLAVQQNGQWVGDIDVLNLEKSPPDIFLSDCHGTCTDEERPKLEEMVSLDCWDEVLDPPPAIGVFRAKKNWIARLAVTAILTQQSHGHALVLVGGDHLCWKCLAKKYSDPEPHLPQFIID
ncbi:uncharacterized protein PG998_010553 [Apiospora kogelbergensis]|uniref:uncharacterized protein n=1 Tax=Apiospora kogelbergensis TaxID=1337665 RepID=UPI00312F93C1